jgi:hypothetical protein
LNRSPLNLSISPVFPLHLLCNRYSPKKLHQNNGENKEIHLCCPFPIDEHKVTKITKLRDSKREKKNLEDKEICPTQTHTVPLQNVNLIIQQASSLQDSNTMIITSYSRLEVHTQHGKTPTSSVKWQEPSIIEQETIMLLSPPPHHGKNLDEEYHPPLPKNVHPRFQICLHNT